MYTTRFCKGSTIRTQEYNSFKEAQLSAINFLNDYVSFGSVIRTIKPKEGSTFFYLNNVPSIFSSVETV